MPIVAEIFKETRKQKSRTLDVESASKLEEIITKSKENPHSSAFELIEECFGPQDRDHVAYFGHGMKPKDVRGPLPSRAQLQAMLHDKEKENIALSKCIDNLEESHKSDMNKLEDQMKKVIDLLMTQQQQANVFGSTSGIDEGQPE